MKAYCVQKSCKKMVDVKDPKEKTTKNGREMISGKCSECGGKVNAFVKAGFKLTDADKKK
jgi:hypothetical protein